MVLERARTSDDADVRPLRAGLAPPVPLRAIPERPSTWRRWRYAAAAVVVAAVGTFVWWNTTSVVPQLYATGHGEQRSWSLADTSVLHLNVDSAATVRYGRAERFVEIAKGQAFFEVAHEPARRFRVLAGTTSVVAVGTQFDVHKDQDLTVVTVVSGRVLVSSSNEPQRELPVAAGEQVRVVAGVLPERATPVDAQRRVAWLQRQIAFDQEPLVPLVAEFNRYGTVPITIETPSLEALQISGVFNIGDTDTFIAFLRTLNDVTVDATPTGIHVSAHVHRHNAGQGVSSGGK